MIVEPKYLFHPIPFFPLALENGFQQSWFLILSMESRRPPSGSPFFAGANTIASPGDPFRDGARFLQAFASPTRRIPPAEKYGCAGTVLKRRRVERGQTIPAVSPRRPGTSRVLAVPGSTSWDACRGALISPGTSCIENSAAYPAVLPIQPFHETPVRSSPPAQTICGRLAGRHDQCAYRQRRGRASCPGTIRLHDADWVK